MNFVVPEPKIVSYLLTNPTKSGFFLKFGYTIQDWSRLRTDILQIAMNSEMEFKMETSDGKKYVIYGEVQSPSGRLIRLKTVWMIPKQNLTEIKLITAYPA